MQTHFDRRETLDKSLYVWFQLQKAKHNIMGQVKKNASFYISM
jgi:hypothetical protein